MNMPRDGFTERHDVAAKAMLEAWHRAEPDSDVAMYPTSYVATFAEMAKAAVDAVDAHDKAIEEHMAEQERLRLQAALKGLYTPLPPRVRGSMAEHPQTTMLREGRENDRAFRQEREGNWTTEVEHDGT